MAQILMPCSTHGRPKVHTPIVVSTGAAEAGKVAQTDSTGKWDPSLIPDIAAVSMTAGEALTAGNFVCIKSDGKVWKAKADAMATSCSGFVRDNANANDLVLVYFEGINDKLSGLTRGSTYFLSNATAGAATTTVIEEDVVQELGWAISTTSIVFEPDIQYYYEGE